MRSRGIADSKVRELTRHETEEMTAHYTDFHLEDFKEVIVGQEALIMSFTAGEGRGTRKGKQVAVVRRLGKW